MNKTADLQYSTLHLINGHYPDILPFIDKIAFDGTNFLSHKHNTQNK